MATGNGEQAVQAELRLTVVDKFLLAMGDGFRGVLRWRQVERQPHLQVPLQAPHAQTEALAQHRHRDCSADHRARLIRRRLTAEVVGAEFQRGQPNAVGPVHFEKAPASQTVARRMSDRVIDMRPQGARKRGASTVEVSHDYLRLRSPMVKRRVGSSDAPALSEVASVASSSIDTMEASV